MTHEEAENMIEHLVSLSADVAYAEEYGDIQRSLKIASERDILMGMVIARLTDK